MQTRTGKDPGVRVVVGKKRGGDDFQMLVHELQYPATTNAKALAAEIKAGNMNFDVVIASPDTMRIVGTLGQILGPRGLMPNPKVGTVTPDVAQAVRNAKAGQVQFRVDKAGIIHGTIGRRSFGAEQLQGNLAALLDALNKAKPASSKGQYLRKVAVSSTMGVGVRVEVASIAV